MSFPRSYISGFVGSADVDNLHFASNVLLFDYLFPLIQVELVVKTQFFFANSNVYTLDYIIDWAASQVYLSGSPIAAGVNIGFYPMTTEQAWRIRVLSTFAPKETERADLNPVAGYWRP